MNEQRDRPDTASSRGNYIDVFVKRMFSRIFVFVDFLVCYADAVFVDAIDLPKVKLAPSHYIGKAGDERIVDLVFRCPLKNGNGNLMAVIVFEHQNKNLREIPQKLLKYISAIWDAEKKEGKPLSVPYFIVLRTGKKPRRRPLPTLADLLPKGPDGKPLGHVPYIVYKIVDLPAWDFRNLVGGPVLRLVLGILKKMLEGNDDEFPEAMLPLREIPDEEQQVELTKELIDFVANAMAAHNRRLDEEMLNRALKPIFHRKERFMIPTIFEERETKARAEGVALGEARGEARGEVRGEVRGEAKSLLTVLRTRFKKVPKKIEITIFKMNDPTALQSWIVFALECQTLKEFEEALR